jgi:poly(beta-D-mannuronate) lyase
MIGSHCLKLRQICLIGWIVCISQSLSQGKQFEPVDSAKGLKEAVSFAKAGDGIIIADGNYTDWAITLDCSGTEALPITIQTQSKSGVIFTGRTNFVFKGRHIQFSGFVFDHCDHEESPIELDQAQHCRIDSCVFQQSGGSKAVVTILPGSRENVIEQCRFLDIAGRSVQVRINESISSLGIPTGNSIRNNHFQDIPPLGDNGRETIQIGQNQPTFGHIRVGTLVEGNTFLRCNGEAEIISNKCSGNSYLRNTFIDCDGELVMRGGGDCLIEGNRLINGKGGIRLCGVGHEVRDNLIVNSRGTGIRLLFGMTKDQGGHYQAAGQCLIENNTIINAAGPGILIGDGKDKDWKEKGVQNVPPTSNQFRNNLVVGNSIDLFILSHAPDNTLEDNSFYQGKD